MDELAIEPASGATDMDELDDEDDRDELIRQHEHIATCLDSTMWLASELAAISRGMANQLLEADALGCISNESAWMARADQMSLSRSLFDDVDATSGTGQTVYRIRTSTAGRLISLLRLAISMLRAG